MDGENVQRNTRESSFLDDNSIRKHYLFPMHFVGLAGMPRRIPDYAVQFTDFNMIASIGAFGFGLSQLLFVYILFQTLRQPVTAADKSWEGAEGLEWTLPSPAPYHSFDTPPKVD